MTTKHPTELDDRPDLKPELQRVRRGDRSGGIAELRSDLSLEPNASIRALHLFLIVSGFRAKVDRWAGINANHSDYRLSGKPKSATTPDSDSDSSIRPVRFFPPQWGGAYRVNEFAKDSSGVQDLILLPLATVTATAA
ncbi:MAG: hypothetical protein K1X57_07915 [Gemmataceae bacterium]|nr:hypothetical protein [Gemmataceae bacterium]